jgi:hypothetical protein
MLGLGGQAGVKKVQPTLLHPSHAAPSHATLSVVQVKKEKKKKEKSTVPRELQGIR